MQPVSVNERTGSLEYPNYPLPYLNHLNCTWRLVPLPGMNFSKYILLNVNNEKKNNLTNVLVLM